MTPAQQAAAEKDAAILKAIEAEHAARDKARADQLASLAAKKVGSGSTAQGTASPNGPTYGRVSDPSIPLDIVDTIEQPVDLPKETRSNGVLLVGAILAGLYLLSKVR